ncbi:MAG: hypothetical protein FWB76_04055 [Oscillospiraceae bacterium]|nr:hypothetical protein [Oscillospiraceae bacterium]
MDLESISRGVNSYLEMFNKASEFVKKPASIVLMAMGGVFFASTIVIDQISALGTGKFVILILCATVLLLAGAVFRAYYWQTAERNRIKIVELVFQKQTEAHEKTLQKIVEVQEETAQKHAELLKQVSETRNPPGQHGL